MLHASNPRAPFTLSSMQPRLTPPDGKPFIIHVVVNIEYWPYDQLTPRTIVIPPHGRSHVPDLPNFCWSEYGNRCGMPRLLELFGDRRLPVSASINASVIDVYPELARQVLDAGWEFVGHGMHQRALSAEANEGDLIRAALDRLEAFTGKRPRGWMSPGWSETFETLDHLSDNGIEYVCQWVIDDIPTRLVTRNGPVVSLPYGLDLNDSVVYAIEKQSSSEMRLRMLETIRTFAREIDRHEQPRVLTIPLHPHLSGVAHRINFLAEIIDTLAARSDTVFMNGSQLLDWYLSASVRE
ncbi:polysaccharide deacetylase family protein [Aquamicrobium terrae]|uniref:Chitooligosaccharide deacetylase n=1 Tax=Aquamicrobium terrae TaxID=1324945 RepID=A0ABV2N7M6_9HYPH